MRRPVIIVLSYNAKRYDAMQNTKKFISGIKNKCTKVKSSTVELIKSSKIADLTKFCFKSNIVKTVCTCLTIIASVAVILNTQPAFIINFLTHIDQAMTALHIPSFGNVVPTDILVDGTKTTDIFKTLNETGWLIIRGFQGLAMVACIIGCFKELMATTFSGDSKDVGGTIFRYAILFACFLLVPDLFRTILKHFGDKTLQQGIGKGVETIVPKTLILLSNIRGGL